MADGVWILHDDGSFELVEPYRTLLHEAKMAGSIAWTEAIVGYLEPKCPYTAQELLDELLRRNDERTDGKVEIFEQFALEALTGDL